MNTDLLQRYIAGDVTEAERKQVLEWIEESPEHLQAYRAQRKLYDIALWRTDISLDEPVPAKRFSWKKPVVEMLKIAAIFALVFVGSYYVWHKPEKPDALQSVYVPAGQRAELVLADGTKVWLNSRSRLTFPGSFGEDTRKVKLDGEGYFAVKSDAEHPFIVETNRYDVRALGTEFNVIAYPNDSIWETSLLKGKIDVLAQGIHVGLEPDTRLSLQGDKLVKGSIREMLSRHFSERYDGETGIVLRSKYRGEQPQHPPQSLYRQVPHRRRNRARASCLEAEQPLHVYEGRRDQYDYNQLTRIKTFNEERLWNNADLKKRDSAATPSLAKKENINFK